MAGLDDLPPGVWYRDMSHSSCLGYVTNRVLRCVTHAFVTDAQGPLLNDPPTVMLAAVRRALGQVRIPSLLRNQCQLLQVELQDCLPPTFHGRPRNGRLCSQRSCSNSCIPRRDAVIVALVTAWCYDWTINTGGRCVKFTNNHSCM